MSRSVREQIDNGLSGVRMSPEMKARVLSRAMKGEKRMKRKLSTGLVIAVAMALLLTGTALAAAQNIFGRFAENRRESASIERNLEIASQNANVKKSVAGLELAVNQTFYDGETLTLAYTTPATIYEDWQPGETERAAMQEAGKMPWWAEGKLSPGKGLLYTHAVIGDGCELLDGTYINPSVGDSQTMKDGSTISWIQFETPLPEAARGRDELGIRLDLLGFKAAAYMDEAGKIYTLPDERPSEKLELTVPRTVGTVASELEQMMDGYTAKLSVTVGRGMNTLVRATITLEGVPREWEQIVIAMKDEGDAIVDYALYIDGEQAPPFEGGIRWAGENKIEFTFSYTQTAGREYRFVPTYTKSGEKPDEALVIVLPDVSELPVNG